MKKTLLATTTLALVAAHAMAVDVELYGQVNKGLFGYNDGDNSGAAFVDNDFSSTRFGVKGSQALDNGLTASVLFETEMQSNDSNTFTQGSDGGSPDSTDNQNSFRERQARVGLSGSFGGVYLGQQSTAIDGVMGRDLGGVTDVMGSNVQYIGGGLVYQGTSRNVTSLSPLFAVQREDSIRYDSPILMGLQARASIAQDGDPEVSLWYDGGYEAFKFSGALGYKVSSGDVNLGSAYGAGAGYKDRIDASFSAAHTSGLAGTVAYQTYDVEGSDRSPENYYGKVSYAWNAYEVAADYGTSDGFISGSQKSYGLGAQYNLGHGVSTAALVRRLKADDVGATDDIDVYGVNMRVKF